MSGQAASVDLEALVASATRWLSQDPDPETRAELEALIAGAGGGGDAGAGAGAAAAGRVGAGADGVGAGGAGAGAGAGADGTGAAVGALAERFDGRLEFGTAGLRAELGAGPKRMNRVVVAQAAAGLGRFLLDSGRERSVVIGYDGRVNSDVFARDSAEILAGLGLAVVLLPSAMPTPVLAFAVRHLGVGAGVMVTASHNPPRDNGYKVYLGGEDDGSQIVPPVDSAIAACIDDVAQGDIRTLERSSSYDIAGPELLDAYVDATAAVAPARPGADQPRVVYTAMHGVGWAVAARVIAAAGFDEPLIVPEQIEPDGTFPTVAFPNPEEPGAMDLAIARGVAAGADLVLANDPDADRLALAIPDGAGSFRRLSGNEVGWLLGWRAAERAAAERAAAGRAAADGTPSDLRGTGATQRAASASAFDSASDGLPRPTLAASIVSSPALAHIASRYGLAYRETLTGFKWVSRVPGLVFGYEEALGYLVDPEVVRDKDGISAMVDLLALAAELRAEGRTIADRLEEFAATFGAFASAQVSVRVEELSRIGSIMSSLRTSPPSALAGAAVAAVTDYIGGADGFPSSDILRWDLDDGSRIIVRPSGTEPKIKVYIDAKSDSPERAAGLVESLAEAVRPLVS